MERRTIFLISDDTGDISMILINRVPVSPVNPIYEYIKNGQINRLSQLEQQAGFQYPVDALHYAIRENTLPCVIHIFNYFHNDTTKIRDYFVPDKKSKYDSIMIEALRLQNQDILKFLLPKKFPLSENELYFCIDSNLLSSYEFLITHICLHNFVTNFSVYKVFCQLIDYAEQTQCHPFAQVLRQRYYFSYIGLPSVCTRDENGNIVDQLTEEPIPANRVITCYHRDTCFNFDVATLYEQYRISGKMINPYNREPLREGIRRRVVRFGEENKIDIVVKFGSRKFTLHIDSDIELGELLMLCNDKNPKEQFRSRTKLIEFDVQLNLSEGLKSVYDFDLLTKFNTLSLKNIDCHVLMVKTQVDHPYFNLYCGVAYPRLWQFCSRKHYFGTINEVIPQIYHIHEPPTLDLIEEDKYLQLRELISIMGTLKDERELAASLYHYIIQQEPHISAKHAHELIELLPPALNKEAVKFRALGCHILYSRVVDKYNLTLNNEIEAIYIMNQYQLPNYQVKVVLPAF